MKKSVAKRYVVLHGAAQHICWDLPTDDGTLMEPGRCPGCDEARLHPCEFCGYGRAFPTHNPEAHEGNGDPQVKDTDRWLASPHVGRV